MNNPLTVVLTTRQRRRLQQLRRRPPAARVARRAICLLLSAARSSNRAITQATGLCSDTITDIRHRWRARGLASLRDRPRAGRPTKITAAYRRELRQALRRGPRAYGYIFTVWSVARLAAHLHQRTALRLGASRLRQLLPAAGFVYRRPKHTLRGKRNETAFRKAQQALTRLKKGLLSRTRLMNSGIRMKPNSICTRT
jgi:transposase